MSVLLVYGIIWGGGLVAFLDVSLAARGGEGWDVTCATTGEERIEGLRKRTSEGVVAFLVFSQLCSSPLLPYHGLALQVIFSPINGELREGKRGSACDVYLLFFWLSVGSELQRFK